MRHYFNDNEIFMNYVYRLLTFGSNQWKSKGWNSGVVGIFESWKMSIDNSTNDSDHPWNFQVESKIVIVNLWNADLIKRGLDSKEK
jgi:hypothetical protein